MNNPMWLSIQLEKAKQEFEKRPDWQKEAIREEVKSAQPRETNERNYDLASAGK